MGCCNNKDTEDLRTERRSIISVNKFDTVHKSIFFNLKCENQFFFRLHDTYKKGRNYERKIRLFIFGH